MKRFLKTISVLLLGFSSISCSEMLDIQQKSVLSTEDYYANAGPDEAEQLIASVYRSYYTGIKGETLSIFLDVLSDDCNVGGSSFADNANQLRNTGQLINTVEDISFRQAYTTFYQLIYYCNLIIERVPDGDSRVARVKAEANFFRAIALFEAIRWYGNPPFVQNVIVTDEDKAMGHGDRDEMIPWILDRIQEAADVLPAMAGPGQQQQFGARLSKHACLAYRAKVALYYGTRYNKPEYIKMAADDLKTVVNSGLYELAEDVSIIGRPAGDFNKENLFEHNSADNDGHPGSPQAHMIPVWVSWRPENMYLPTNLQSMGWGWAPPSGAFGDFMVAHDGIDSPRFKSTILTYDQVLELDYADANRKGCYVPIVDSQGYFRNRYLLYKDDIYDVGGFYKYSMANAVFMRYAEVLLMYAEAKFLADNDSDGKGLEALNQVRVRAGITPLSSMSYQDIKDERRAELWCQQERFFDLLRWHDAAEAYKDRGKVWYTFSGYKPGTTEWNITEQPGMGNGWHEKYEYFPYAQAQLTANPNLKQNPGW